MEVKRRKDLGLLLNEMGLLGEAAEIGVHRGDFSRKFLDRWNGKCLHLVDPWRPMADYDSDAINHGNRDDDRAACMLAVQPHLGRVIQWRMTSAEAAQKIPDGLLDFCYIDANHEEAFVRQDLGLWWPKVHSGGIFAGHDILTRTWPGVAKAVEAFRAEHNLPQPNITWETGGSYWFIKP